MSKMWGGRFDGELDPFFDDFQRSIGFDHELAHFDLLVNAAWAEALGAAGVLEPTEVERLQSAIDELRSDWESDGLTVDFTAEDIHSFVEQQLTEKVGDLARRLHAGRSRNDQVATDLKLWMFERLAMLILNLQDLIEALVGLAEEHADAPIPGYTHLQRAQPITIGHHALAYAEMLGRDRSRLIDLWRRADTCPLGSAALAGTAFDVDRERLAEVLEFSGGPTRNSLDAVSDRDHVCEALFCCSMIMTHLSRLAEDYIFFASYEAGFLTFDDSVATGSSLMPQKKNPDAMELIRGKTGRVAGHLTGMLMTLKGLPLAYDRDLQEDKEGLIDAIDQTDDGIVVATTAVRSASFDVERCRSESRRGYLNATDLADFCVRQGMPFRDAHEAVGRAVKRALELEVELEALPDEELESLFPGFDRAAMRAALDLDEVLDQRAAIGGTAPQRVREECARWAEEISTWRD
ncbi:MAG: argininosuccinate lyase [Planctomycetes bacterium]|nr:argininosuccinate lyase [Planctomycetota bacterium]